MGVTDIKDKEPVPASNTCKSEETKANDSGSDSDLETKFMALQLSKGNGRKYCSVIEAISKSNKPQIDVISPVVSLKKDDKQDLQTLMANLKVSETAQSKIILPQTSDRTVSSVVKAQTTSSNEAESNSNSDENHIPIERGGPTPKLSISNRVAPYSRTTTPHTLSSSPQNNTSSSDVLTIHCVSQAGGNGGTLQVLSSGTPEPSLPQPPCNIHLNGSRVLITEQCQQTAQINKNANRVQANIPSFTLQVMKGSGSTTEALSPHHSYIPRSEVTSPFSTNSISSPSSNDTYSSPSSVQSESSDNSSSVFNLEFKKGLVIDQDRNGINGINDVGPATSLYSALPGPENLKSFSIDNFHFHQKSLPSYAETFSSSSYYINDITPTISPVGLSDPNNLKSFSIDNFHIHQKSLPSYAETFSLPSCDINDITPTISPDVQLLDPENLKLYSIDPNDKFESILNSINLEDLHQLFPLSNANTELNNCQTNSSSINMTSSQFLPIAQPSRSRSSSGNSTSSEEKEQNFQRILNNYPKIAPRPNPTTGIPSAALGTCAAILIRDSPCRESTSARQRLINTLTNNVLRNRARAFVNAKTKFAYFLKGDDQGDTPLHHVINDHEAYTFEVVEHFAKNNVIVDVPNNLGQTPLFCAVARNKPLIVEYLIESGANPCHLCIDGTTPLHVVAKYGDSHLTVAQVLCKWCQPNQLDKKNLDGYTPIVYAIKNCRSSHFKFIKILLEADAQIDGRAASGTDGKSALHLAVQMGSLELVRVICQSCKTIAHAVNHPNFRGDTALHLAAQLSDENVQMAIVDVLVENGAKSSRNKEGKEPMDLVCADRTQLKRILHRIEKLQ